MALIYRFVVVVSLLLALLGLLLPLLPTTPFLLVAAWAASRVHPDWVRKLEQNRLFGPPLVRWQRDRSLSVTTRRVALGVLGGNWLLLWAMGYSSLVLGVVALVSVSVGLFLMTLTVTRSHVHDAGISRKSLE